MKKLLLGALILVIIFNFIPTVVINSFAADKSEVRKIYFPTDTSFIFNDTFGAGRYERNHEGTDIMGEQMAELYAAVDGEISYITGPEASWGYHLVIKDRDGYTYHYLHINNDTLGTDDGEGGVENAYVDGINQGASVVKGQLIAWMGDSGNAENVGHHLHFEIREPDGTAINAYASLIAALLPGGYSPEEEIKNIKTINEDKELIGDPRKAICVSNSRIKLADSQTVYYCAADSKRYVFPNSKIYFTWFDDFEDIENVSLEDIAKIPLGGNVTYKPGSRLLKLRTDPKVYAIEKGGALRWVQSAETAEALYGENWKEMVDDLPDSFFFNYTIGEPIILEK